MGLQTNVSERTEEEQAAAGYVYDEDDGSSFVSDYVVSEDEEVARHFRTAIQHLSQYARVIRSIDTLYGIIRESDGIFIIEDSP